MVTLVVVCCGLLSALPPDSGGPAPDLAAYEAAYTDARSRVGRDPDAHVRLALWCEARGLDAARLRHLAIAALIDPGHAAARGLMGLVAHAGQWKRPEAVADQVKADEELAATLEQYKARRDKAPAKPDAQWKLALWCEENGLGAEARAHLTLVTRLDPDHAAARKRLGYKKQGGRWTTAAQLAEEKVESEKQKKADRAWRPRLERWRDMLGGKDEAKRAEAERALFEVTDPHAVPAVWAVFGTGTTSRQTIAVQLLGQIDGPGASRALMGLAVLSLNANIRQIATQTLARRDPRDFVGLLVDRLRDPIKYEVRPVNGPGSPGILFVEGTQYDVRRMYGTPAVHPQANMPRVFTSDVPFDPFSRQNILMANGMMSMTSDGLAAQALQGLAANPRNAPSMLAQPLRSQQPRGNEVAIPQSGGQVGLPMVPRGQSGTFLTEDVKFRVIAAAALRDYEIGLVASDIQRAALEAQQRLSNDVRALEMTNSDIHQMNGRLLPVLEGVTGQGYGEDRAAWQAWWTDQEGFTVQPEGRRYKPVIDQRVEVRFEPIPITSSLVPVAPPWSMSCFGAGTSVHTREGSSPIESVKVGDQVLAQDVLTGALSYQPVLARFHNPPTRPLRVTLGDEAIIATGIHRFWRAGHGWVMARDLKPGDALRTLGGMARVTAVEPLESQPVFNLEVAGQNTFFVGEQGALVHDNSLVRPTPEPFDVAPELAAVARTPRPAPR